MENNNGIYDVSHVGPMGHEEIRRENGVVHVVYTYQYGMYTGEWANRWVRLVFQYPEVGCYGPDDITIVGVTDPTTGEVVVLSPEDDADWRQCWGEGLDYDFRPDEDEDDDGMSWSDWVREHDLGPNW